MVMKLKWFFVLALMLFAAPARAANPEVNLNDFKPSLHAWDISNIMTTRIAPHLKVSGGLWFTYRKNPWSLETAPGAEVQVLSDQVVAELYAALPLADLVSIGVGMPIFFLSKGDAPSNMPPAYNFTQASGASFGDLRLSAKVRFWKKRKKGFGLGLAMDFTFPTATGSKFTGEKSVTWKPTLVVDWGRKGFVVALNIGYLVRGNDVRVDPIIADELNFGIGLQIPLICDKLDLLFSWNTRTLASSPFSASANVGSLVQIGARIRLWKGLFLAATGGFGLGHLYGIPTGQFALNFGWEPRPRDCRRADRDGDGIPDDQDKCPDVKGPKSTQGCPDRDGDDIADSVDKCPDNRGPVETGGCPDRDRDGIIDKDDRCINKPGSREFKGCPDSDGDGVPDIDDRCPTVPGLKRLNGCPLKDTDKDGIPDGKDDCPDKAGLPRFKGCPDSDGDGVVDSKDACPSKPGPESLKGCPDSDKDGIADKDDKCPNEWGTAEHQGCPPPRKVKITVTPKKVIVFQRIHFKFNRAVIRQKSIRILRAVAKVLKDNAWIKKLRVEGHTDNVGSKAFNLPLSTARAKAVRRYLIAQGIAAHRLTARGFWFSVPLVPGDDKAARAQNRRVEFKIIEPR